MTRRGKTVQWTVLNAERRELKRAAKKRLEQVMLKESTRRAILRTVHLILAIPIIGYNYR